MIQSLLSRWSGTGAAATSALCLVLVCALSQSGRAQNPLAKVDYRIAENLASEGRSDVIVRFGESPDLSAADLLPTKAEKARFVYETLQRNARRHAPMLARLTQEGLDVRHLWAANAVYVAGATAEEIARIRAETGVAELHAVPSWSIDDLERDPIRPTSGNEIHARAELPTWGLRFLNVPEVWALGIRGDGAVVGGADTGYDWDHPALIRSYRGNTLAGVQHDYNWFDGVTQPFPGSNDANPCGFSVDEPCDDGSHGTHTMGTMVGAAPGEQIGVAPEASWIACRNMDRGNGTPVTYLACFQFFLAPTDLDGNNPRPELAPDVIANSWYCPRSEGCDTSNFPLFDNIVDALRAAGTVVVASAGNSGNAGCNTISRVPSRAPGAFVVGAHDSLGVIAPFSSKGLARLDSDQVRPDVALPGVAVRSSVPNGGYGVKSGTSMSGPHAVGVFALMISANPALHGQVDTLEDLFRRSVTPTLAPANDTCSAPGATVPNAVYGYGLGNALRAVELAQAWGGVSATASAKTPRFRLAPNPSSGEVRVELLEILSEAELIVSDLAGRQVYHQEVGASSTQALDLQSLPRGVYVVSLRAGDGVRSERLILQ